MVLPRLQALFCGSKKDFGGRREWWMIVSMLGLSFCATSTWGWVMDRACDDGDDFEIGRFELARAQAGELCVSITWPLLVLSLALQFTVGSSCMTMASMGSMYLTEARPEAKSTVIASQRVCQQLGAAVAFAIGGFLFNVAGPGVICTVVGVAVLLSTPLMLGVARDPSSSKDDDATVVADSVQ